MLEKIKERLEADLYIEIDELTPETKFTDLGADSLDMLNLVMEIEEEKGIMFDTNELAEIKTIGELMAIFEREGIEL